MIAANPELREREALKGLSLIAAMTDALRRRGVPDMTSGVAAVLGSLALKIAYERWSDTASGDEFGEVARRKLSELQAASAGYRERLQISGLAHALPVGLYQRAPAAAPRRLGCSGTARPRSVPAVTTGGPGPPGKGRLAPHRRADVSRRSNRKPGRSPARLPPHSRRQ